MDILTAKKEGVKGFLAGLDSSPFSNIKFKRSFEYHKYSNKEYLKAYQHGWRIACLASAYFELTTLSEETINSFPCTIEYKKLKNMIDKEPLFKIKRVEKESNHGQLVGAN